MSGLVMKNFQRLARSFLAGILAVLPVVITVAIVAWVAGFVRQILGPGTLIGEALTTLGLRFVTNDSVAYFIGGLLVLGCVLVIGVFVQAGAKNLVQRLSDLAMQRIPIIGSIYGTSNNLTRYMNWSRIGIWRTSVMRFSNPFFDNSTEDARVAPFQKRKSNTMSKKSIPATPVVATPAVLSPEDAKKRLRANPRRGEGAAKRRSP